MHAMGERGARTLQQTAESRVTQGCALTFPMVVRCYNRAVLTSSLRFFFLLVSTMCGSIPGAHHVDAEEIAEHHDAIPRDRDVVLYCT